jgi:3-isopropylmalate dehydrogenase
MKTLRIAVLAGDGIGPEVIAQGVRALRAAEQMISGDCFELQEFSVGAGEYLRSGDPLPTDTLQGIGECDAVLLGAMGLPDVRRQSGVEMAPQLDLREHFELYAGIRPIFLFHGLDSPLKAREAGAIDLVIVRESTEGLFSGRKGSSSLADAEACDVMRVSRRGCERLFRAAFRLAAARRKHVTLVDKANVLPSMAYFRGIFDEIAREFPDVATERIYVDAAALYLVERPQTFDVIVTENMFGDILSDLAAGLVGGMGMAPSGDIGDRFAVFQPSHGSAPTIAGRGIANPVATILSVGMMLDWLGAPERAGLIQAAVRRVFADPQQRTVEMGGSLGTAAMGDAIVDAMTMIRSEDEGL